MLSVCLFSLLDAVAFYAYALSSSSLASFVAASLDKSPLTSAASLLSVQPWLHLDLYFAPFVFCSFVLSFFILFSYSAKNNHVEKNRDAEETGRAAAREQQGSGGRL